MSFFALNVFQLLQQLTTLSLERNIVDCTVVMSLYT